MSKRASYIVGLPLLGAAILYTLGDRMPGCVGLRVLATGATIFGAKLECGLDAVAMALSPAAKTGQPTSYTFQPGVQCSWQPVDKAYRVNNPLKTGADGSYVIGFSDARLEVQASGRARLADLNGQQLQDGNCHRVGGL